MFSGLITMLNKRVKGAGYIKKTNHYRNKLKFFNHNTNAREKAKLTGVSENPFPGVHQKS
jgi:hypothetical protein